MDGIAWAGSAMVAARTRLEIAANNLANVSTGGFRGSEARGFLSARGVVIQRLQSAAHGALRHTGRAFDLAIVGNGGFRVRDARGRIVSTRAGAFSLDSTGHLRDDAGRVLLGSGNAALHVPDGATIDANGNVARDGRVIDRLPLAPGSTVRSGFLEAANVDAIGQMVSMLAAERSFESAQKVVAAIDETRKKAASDVGKVS